MVLPGGDFSWEQTTNPKGNRMRQWRFTVVLYGRGEEKGDAWQDAVMNFAEQTDGPSISDDLGDEEFVVNQETGITDVSTDYLYSCFEDTLEFAEGLGWSVRNPDEWDGDDLEGDALDHIMKSGYEVVYPADN